MSEETEGCSRRRIDDIPSENYMMMLGFVELLPRSVDHDYTCTTTSILKQREQRTNSIPAVAVAHVPKEC